MPLRSRTAFRLTRSGPLFSVGPFPTEMRVPPMTGGVHGLKGMECGYQMTQQDSTVRHELLAVMQDAFAAALVEADLGEEATARLFGNLAGFTARFREGTDAALTEAAFSRQFADEEVPSQCGYRSGYRGPIGVDEQLAALRGQFPELGGYDPEARATPVRSGAEGLFLVPRWERIAPTYGEALERAFAALRVANSGRFTNYRGRELGPGHLRRHPHAADAFARLAARQKGHDVLVVPAQFGARHRGRSIRRAREVFRASEFGLGAFEVACMLLTHKNRLGRCDDLGLDVPGDEHDPGGLGAFVRALGFAFDGEGVTFDSRWLSGAHSAGHGSATGFVPS